MNLPTTFKPFMNKVRDVGGISFALTKSRHRQLLDAYKEVLCETEAPDAVSCDDLAQLHDFLFS